MSTLIIRAEKPATPWIYNLRSSTTVCVDLMIGSITGLYSVNFDAMLIIIIDDVFVLYWKRGHALTADLFPQYRV
jgi:hypothetical protein